MNFKLPALKQQEVFLSYEINDVVRQNKRASNCKR